MARWWCLPPLLALLLVHAAAWLNTTTQRRLSDRKPARVVADARAAISDLNEQVAKLYGVPPGTMGEGVTWLSKHGSAAIVDRLLRAMVTEDSFVVSVGGMSDTAGHGNKREESYPLVMLTALRPVFEAAGINLVVRNMAMGGVPSFPNSLCMKNQLGADTDLVVWDFRMVERDDLKGELYIRHALYLPRQAFVMFKRQNPYLRKLQHVYGDVAALHVIDETDLFNKLHKRSDAVKADSFCKGGCSCPGQVRWHSGWKMHRLRGLQMAVVYAQVLSKAVTKYADLAAAGLIDSSHERWGLHTRAVPKCVSKEVKSAFGGPGFECGISWQPRVGLGLRELIDSSPAAKGGTQWTFKDPNKRISDSGAKCGYLDNKEALEGRVDDGWVFFALTHVGEGGTIGFCADFPKDKRLKDFEFLVVLNSEEVQGHMTYWHDARTLGVSLQCYGTTHMVRAGDNSLGFRVMERGQTMRLTHVLWSGAEA